MVSVQQTNLLPKNASQNDAIFAQKVYRIYATTSQYLSSYGCAITMVYIYIYIVDVAVIYCTTIYIVKYRQSIAFGNICIGGHFPVPCVGESHKKDLRKSHKSLFVIVLNIALGSLDVNISVVRTTASMCACHYIFNCVYV